MNSPDPSNDQSAKPILPWMNRFEQILWAILLTIFIALSSVYIVYYRFRQTRFIDIEKNVPRFDYRLAIDVNSAEWAELTVLPGISETYARRIIDYRSQHGVFQSIDDLANVPGIGPKRLEQIRSFLYVDESSDSTEKSNHSELKADHL